MNRANHSYMLTRGQASIDYLRYLEKCIVDLKAANNSLSTPLVQPQAPPPRSHMSQLDHNDEGEDEEDDDDIEMENTDSMTTSPVFASAHSSEPLSCTSPQSITPSPALDAMSQYQTSSYASSVSTLPSPHSDLNDTIRVLSPSPHQLPQPLYLTRSKIKKPRLRC